MIKKRLAYRNKNRKKHYNYQVRRKKLTQILSQDTSLANNRIQQAKEQYAHMKSTLALMRKKVEV
jgi:HlyD family secretion protein